MKRTKNKQLSFIQFAFCLSFLYNPSLLVFVKLFNNFSLRGKLRKKKPKKKLRKRWFNRKTKKKHKNRKRVFFLSKASK